MKPNTRLRILTIRDAAIAYNLGKLNTTQFMALVEALLKQQDRDTRHACAEATAWAITDSEENKILSGFGPKAQIALYQLTKIAHTACINTRAV